MRIENVPGGKLYEQFVITALAAHPYRFPTVGWDSDIRTVTKRQAREFYDAYYSPRNAVVALVGNYDIEQAKKMARRYFGRLKNKGEIRQVTTKEPVQTGERRNEVFFDAQPDMMIGWHKPTLPHPDSYVFDVLEDLLARGRSSRLFKRLVKTKKAAGAWSYQVPGDRYDNVFCISVAPQGEYTLAQMQEETYAELELLKNELVDSRELEKIIKMIEARHVWSLKSNSGMAQALTRFQLLTGDWRFLDGYLKELRKVTPERIRDVARRYFLPTNRTVVELKKKAPSSVQEGRQ
jgi:predicted Zn-dependent peptidase